MHKVSSILAAVLVGAVALSAATGVRTLMLADEGTPEVAAAGVEPGPSEPGEPGPSEPGEPAGPTSGDSDRGESESKADVGGAADRSGSGDATVSATADATALAEQDIGLVEDDLQKADHDVDRGTEADIEEVVETALGSPNQVEPDEAETAVVEDLPEVAQGELLAELQAQVAEYDSLGWQQDGVPTVEDITLLMVDSQENTNVMVVQACVDWSEVTYNDANGKALSPSATPRALNIFTLQRDTVNDPWVPVTRDFPENPAC